MVDQFRMSFAGDPGLDGTLNELARDLNAAGCQVVKDSSEVPAKGVELVTAISVSLASFATVRPVILRILTMWAQRPRDRAFILEKEHNGVTTTVMLRASGLDSADYQATMASIAALLEAKGTDGA